MTDKKITTGNTAIDRMFGALRPKDADTYGLSPEQVILIELADRDTAARYMKSLQQCLYDNGATVAQSLPQTTIAIEGRGQVIFMDITPYTAAKQIETVEAMRKIAKIAGPIVILFDHGGNGGPQRVKHIVDTVLTVEATQDGFTMHTTKNRYGESDITLTIPNQPHADTN